MHPTVLAPLEDPACDDRLVNELFGFVMRCAAQSGAHLTDYVVTRGTAVQMAGQTRVEELLGFAIRAGYFTAVELDGRTAYKIIDDPEFIHLRLREEVEWERQRKRDTANPALRIPVRFRDGDACRWCGRVVNWGAKKGPLCGTYDHLHPGQAATIDTLLVACRGCNSQRRDTPEKFTLTLMPEPSEPYYSPATVELLSTNEWAQRNGYTLPSRTRRKVIRPGEQAPTSAPRTVTDTQSTPTSESASSSPSQRPGGQPGNATRPDNQSGNAPTEHASAEPGPVIGTESESNPRQTASNRTPQRSPRNALTSTNTRSAKERRKYTDSADRTGTATGNPGRDGSGRDGPGRDGHPNPSTTSPPGPSNRRGRRRRRPRTTS